MHSKTFNRKIKRKKKYLKLAIVGDIHPWPLRLKIFVSVIPRNRDRGTTNLKSKRTQNA